tara:strand:+ start:75 stop:662 length:588 start_codon:yes stop_codon:yes gene_type:complete
MIKLNIPIIISIMGVDGSGKTTIAKNLNKRLKKSKYLHLRPYILFQDRRRVVRNPHLQKKSSSLVSFLRILSWLISYIIFFTSNKNLKICIFDRYAHDILIDPLRYKHNLSFNLTKFVLNFFPKPNMWIFLNPPLETIKTRKLELSDKEYKKQVNSYVKLFRHKKNVLRFNTIISKKKITLHIEKKINELIKNEK